MQQGKYIVVEGLDGAGKGTVIKDLSAHLTELGVKFIVLVEPGSTALGGHLRKIVKDADYPIDPVAETMLFAAARRQLWKEVVEPALLSGTTVLSDRGLFTSYAYQGGSRGCFEQVLDLAAITFDRAGLVYDLTLFLDVTPEVGLARSAKRGELDRIELEGLGFMSTARDYYNDLWEDTAIACYTRSVVRVDADKSPADVSAQCRTAVTELFSTTGE